MFFFGINLLEFSTGRDLGALKGLRSPVIEAMYYNNLDLKTENGGFSTFAGVFDPENGRIGFVIVPTSLFSRRIQRRLPFVQDISSKFSKNIANPVSNIYRSFIRKKGLSFR